MGWVEEEFERLKGILADDRAAWDRLLSPFWNGLKLELTSDAEAFNRLAKRGDGQVFIRAVDRELTIGFEVGAELKVSVDVPNRCIDVERTFEERTERFSIPVETRQGFQGLSKRLLMAILFPRNLRAGSDGFEPMTRERVEAVLVTAPKSEG